MMPGCRRPGAVLLGLLIIGPAGGAALTPAGSQSGAPAAAPGLRVFGAGPAQAARRLGADKLDGALAEIAQRYASISVDHPLADLRAINPAARFRLRAPLATPEVLIDAVTTGDAQALKRAPAASPSCGMRGRRCPERALARSRRKAISCRAAPPFVPVIQV
jgi:hypothetical protein